MKEQLLLLLELQTIDTRVHELRTEIAALPQKLEAAKQDLAKLESMLMEEKRRLAESESWRKEQEELIGLEDEAIRKAKSKLQGAKNSKDYTAANRELDNKRRSKSEREDEMLKVLDALEKSRAQASAHEKDVEALRAHVQAEDQRVSAIVAKLEAEVSERSVGRDAIVAKIDPKLMARYQRVMRSRSVAVVPVVNGVCKGCHMAIPPQLNNNLIRMSNIESCPRCTRLIYRKEILDEPTKEAKEE